MMSASEGSYQMGVTLRFHDGQLFTRIEESKFNNES